MFPLASQLFQMAVRPLMPVRLPLPSVLFLVQLPVEFFFIMSCVPDIVMFIMLGHWDLLLF